MSDDQMDSEPKKLRGFASMTPERRRELARKGGFNVKKDDRSFSKSKELASAAGKKGGQKVAAEKRSFSTNRALAREAGKKGREASLAKAKRQKLSGETIH